MKFLRFTPTTLTKARSLSLDINIQPSGQGYACHNGGPSGDGPGDTWPPVTTSDWKDWISTNRNAAAAAVAADWHSTSTPTLVVNEQKIGLQLYNVTTSNWETIFTPTTYSVTDAEIQHPAAAPDVYALPYRTVRTITNLTNYVITGEKAYELSGSVLGSSTACTDVGYYIGVRFMYDFTDWLPLHCYIMAAHATAGGSYIIALYDTDLNNHLFLIVRDTDGNTWDLINTSTTTTGTALQAPLMGYGGSPSFDPPVSNPFDPGYGDWQAAHYPSGCTDHASPTFVPDDPSTLVNCN